jgi:acetyltransferase-like isoleucine patch superfamily enzyme
MLNVLLVKARYDPPWSAMFSSVLTRVFPLGPLYSRLFGPSGSSVTMGDTVLMVDPHLVELGRNVELGHHTVITCHVFDNRGLLIRKVKIGDGAVIGPKVKLMAGVQIGEYARIGTRAMVMPNTVIGAHEYWDGEPAVKIRDLAPDADEPHAVPRAEALERVVPAS